MDNPQQQPRDVPSEQSKPAEEPVVVGRIVGPESEDVSDEPLGRLGRSKLAVLATIFVAAGILGLPLLYYSKAFSRAERVFWTIMTLLYTVLVFYILYRAILWIVELSQRAY